MDNVKDFLVKHLGSLAGPYLFVGAGFSRRYANTPSWRELLEKFAAETGMPLSYYETGSLPLAATKIGEVFREQWFRSEDYLESRDKWETSVSGSPSLPLKVEISAYLETCLRDFEPPVDLREEWQLLTQATVDGVITTNYDDLLEIAFPTYRVYIGQDGLLFSDPQGIAEIYAIHGSTKDPASLVLDESDYLKYEDRNAYLAAKLLTVFVEHPVIFLGYSFGDPNIQQILLSIVKGLQESSVEKLQDRLIFIEWSPDSEPEIQRTHMTVEGTLLPIIRITVSDWKAVFQALGARKHALNARTLRILKEQVYEVVLSNDPKDRLFAYKHIDDEIADEISIVFGVGAKVATVGVIGIQRKDAVADVLGILQGGFPANEMVSRLIAGTPTRTWFPMYKYLSEAGWLDKEGALDKDAGLPQRVLERDQEVRKQVVLRVKNRRRQPFERLHKKYGSKWILKNILEIPSYTSDLEGLKKFLIGEMPVDSDNVWHTTQLVKGVVVYDYWKHTQ